MNSTQQQQHFKSSQLVSSALLLCLVTLALRYEPVNLAAAVATTPDQAPTFSLATNPQQQQHGPSLCPLVRDCHCKWASGKQGANCERRGLATIPAQLPQATQVLDFSSNAIGQLAAHIFQDKHLTNLQKLHLSECKISFIADEAFAQLTNLIDLDLSNNNLLTVPSKSFEPIRHSLRKLSLANNPIQVIESDSFSSLKHLITLDLHNCQLAILKPNAFHGLSLLSDLKLADNRLTQIPMHVMMDIPDNSILDLYGNPWHCDCELRQAIDWMSRHHIQQAFAPTCATPQRHKDIRWQNVKPEEFICPPMVINKQNDLVVGAGSNVSLACSARGSAPLTFVWFQDEKNLTTGRANVTEPPASTKLLEEKRYEIAEELGLPGQPNVTTSILYLFNLKLTDTSLFLCWVENAAGYTIANFSLVVNDSPPAQLAGATASANSLLQSIGLSQADTQLGIISLGFIIVLVTATILLLVIKHGTNRSSKSSQSSDLKSSTKVAKGGDGNNNMNTTSHKNLANIGTISASSKFGNGGAHQHSRSMLADSEDIDDDDDDIDGGDLDNDDDRSSSGSGSSCSKNPKTTTTVASGDLDGFIDRMRSGIINMDYHSMSPVIQFNNTLKKNNNTLSGKTSNNNNNATNQQHQLQQSLPYLDTSHHQHHQQPMHHFPSASNASSVPYYGNGSSMATTTSDLSPSSGSVNANFANQHHHQLQLLHHQHPHQLQHQPNNLNNCDLQQHHLNEMAPATNQNNSSYNPNDYHQGVGYGEDHHQNNMMPPMYYETSAVDPNANFHPYHHQLQQHHHPHHMNNNQPNNNSHLYPPGSLVAADPAMVASMTSVATPSTMIVGHPGQQQQGDLVLQSLMQQGGGGRMMPNQQRLLRQANTGNDDEFHQVL